MCSTPRPKQKVKGKPYSNVVSILASLDSEARMKFTQRANQASIHRGEIKAQEHAKQVSQKALVIPKPNKAKKLQRSWLYWLLSASISDIFRHFFHLQKK